MKTPTCIYKYLVLIISLLLICSFCPVFLVDIHASSLRRDSSTGYVTQTSTGQRHAKVYASQQDDPIREFAELADAKQRQAQEKNTLINSHYNKGKAYYASKKYKEAKVCFEQILEIEPSYEPARLFLQSVVIQEGIIQSRRRIEGIKMQLADIMAEYDKRVQRADSLAVKYFLELAQKECQVGNFQAAENYYNLCYKVYPYSKERIEWFVKATHDLMVLYNKLDEENAGMEELVASLR
jgi:tetratricopeptide (TPR) repeat protein